MRHESEHLSSPTIPHTQRQRDWGGASIEGDHTTTRAPRESYSPRSLPASAGMVPRSSLKHTVIVRSAPFCVNRWDRPRAQRQRDWGGASIEGDHTIPRAQRESYSPRSLPASAGMVPRSFLTHTVIVRSAPFCVNRWDRPLQGALGENQRKRNPPASVPPEMVCRVQYLATVSNGGSSLKLAQDSTV